MFGNASQIVRLCGKALVILALLVPLIFSWTYLGDCLPVLQLPLSIPSLVVLIAAYDLVLMLIVELCEGLQLSIPEGSTKFIDRFGLAIPVACHVGFLLMFVVGFNGSIFAGEFGHILYSVALMILAVLYPIVSIIVFRKSHRFFAACSILAFGPCVALAIMSDSFLVIVASSFVVLFLFALSASKLDKEHPVSPTLLSSVVVLILVCLAALLVPAFIDCTNAVMPLLGSNVQVELPSALTWGN